MSAKKTNDLYERELQWYRETLANDKDEALKRFGMTLINSINPAERASALRALGMEMNEPVDYYNLGVQAARDENWSEAIVHFKKAIELNPDLTDAIYNLALCYERTGHIPQAKSTWQVYTTSISDREEIDRIKRHISDDLSEG